MEGASRRMSTNAEKMIPTLYILCGCPGSGKTYWAMNFYKNSDKTIFWCSRDNIRFSLLKENEDYFSHELEVFRLFSAAIRYELRNGTDVIADATHLNRASRKRLLHSLYDVEFNIIYVYFTASFETCCARNNLREGRARVPEKNMIEMYNKFEPPTKDEDNRCIGVWRVDE